MTQFRSIFISDMHLGCRWCQAKLLASFLSSVECENLFLVGDIIDGWKLKRRSSWPQSHNKVLRKILKMSKKTRICYIPGNHDEFLDEFDGYHFGHIEIARSAKHVTADGRRFLVIHGDEFDLVVKYKRWLAVLGDLAYEICLQLNSWLNSLRSLLGLGYWSFSEYLKHKVKDAVNFIGDFENALLHRARTSGVDGIICGHIHRPAIRQVENITYANCGDWVESCSALVEHPDGTLEILRWKDMVSRIPFVTTEGEMVFRDPDSAPRPTPDSTLPEPVASPL
ncbi:UDP-2,3-diacylglucosamine diphosphatase [Aminiphilus circumscriptus]|uniref:UDP-2,3-diacylglucosamine diphosphatase n=1 Tax=Aminiphilus circumscriptus TaxID=290732 RepID=UPI000478662D|nr:UDP-2,3-diacylglucosamine diphosphatase [Aminiphilus circumscriptus]